MAAGEYALFLSDDNHKMNKLGKGQLSGKNH